MTEYNIGIDISKDHLDAHNLNTGASRQFDNDSAGFLDLTRWLPKVGLRRIVFEPTGPYHRAFSLALGAKFPLVKVNPLQARRFAQARGVRAKTDAIDACILAQMGMAFNLEPDPAPSQEALDLKELRVARLTLNKQSTRLKNRLKTLNVPLLKCQARKQTLLVQKQIAEIDAEIYMRMSHDQTTVRKMDILCSVPGLGKISAAALLIEMPELGSLKRKQVASLSGLAPISRESGHWRGKAYIQGGRKPLRDALYMPAVVAMRYNPNLKEKYQSLVAAGKPPKVAIVALMRKLIELANALIKANRLWENKRA